VTEKEKGTTVSISPPEDSAYSRYRKLMNNKPIVSGEAVSYQFLPAGGYWGGLVKKGQVIRVVDLEGSQCFDMIMYEAHDIYDRICCAYTITKEGKWDNWKPGDGIWSRKCEKLAMITEDTSEGHHAVAGAFCSEAFDRVVCGIPNMHSCHDNFVSAMRMAGFPEFSAKDIDYGSCISVFMYIKNYPDGSVALVPTSTKLGDYIDFMAEKDLIVTISNDPFDIGSLNNWKTGAMYAVIFNPNQEYVSKANALKHTREAEYKQWLGYSEDDYKVHVIRDEDR